MAYVSDMFDQLRDLLGDQTDTQVPFATKKLYLNRGIARLWPHVYKVAQGNIPIVAGTYDYYLPNGAMGGHVLAVELSTSVAATTFTRLDQYDVIAGDEDFASAFRFGLSPDTYADHTVRVTYAARLPSIAAASYAAAQSEVWTGLDAAMNLPVLYAMGMIAARKLDDRQDTSRYSTTQALNGVTDNDIMGSSQMWFGMFETELIAMERPLPIARD